MKPILNLTDPATYRIRIAGRVEADWSDFMMDPVTSFSSDEEGSWTLITGVVPDQAALFGLLCQVRDLSMALVSVEYLPGSQGDR